MASLFDSAMFSPSNYGGLLGTLLSRLQFPQPEPSSGFSGTQTYASGGLPYPVMGQSDQIPPAAQPVQYSPPQSAPQQVPTALQSPPGGNLGAGLTGFANARGLLPAISNLFQGLTTGQRTDPSGMMQQAAQATYQALKSSGVPDGVAQAAALNPEVLKTIAPQLYTKPELKILTGQTGNQIPYWANPSNQTLTPALNGPAGTQVGGGTGVDPNLTGDEFLKAVSADPSLGPGKAQMIKAIAEGRQPYPSGFLLKTPFGQWLTTAVGQYEPGLDATLIGQRATFNKQMGSATPTSVGGQKTLMGTSLGHLAEVADAAVGLNNSDAGAFSSVPGAAPVAHGYNAVKNTAVEQAARANKLIETVDRFSGEVGKLYSGSSGGGVSERESTRSRFGPNQTPQELAAGLEAARDLIKSKLDALENQQDQIFGPNNKNRVDFLGQNGRSALTKIDAAIAKLKAGDKSNPSVGGNGWSIKKL